jgi:hypothetical protein
MRCIVEFSQTNSDGQRELIDSVRPDVPAPSDAKTLKHSVIRGCVADVAVIKSMKRQIICVVDARRDTELNPELNQYILGAAPRREARDLAARATRRP